MLKWKSKYYLKVGVLPKYGIWGLTQKIRAAKSMRMGLTFIFQQYTNLSVFQLVPLCSLALKNTNKCVWIVSQKIAFVLL